jgi:chemotaxis protein MotB
VAQLSGSLQNTVKARDQLELLLEQMTARAALLEDRAAKAEQALIEAETKISANRETVELRVRQLESLRRDIASLRQLRAELEAEIAALSTAVEESGARSEALEQSLDEARVVILSSTEQRTALEQALNETRNTIALLTEKQAAMLAEFEADRSRVTELESRSVDLRQKLEESRRRIVILSARSDSLTEELEAGRAQVGALRDRSKQLEAKLASEQERTLLAQKEIERREVRLSELIAAQDTSKGELDDERKLSEERRSQIALLNLQITRLREDLSHLQSLLDAAEEKDRKSEATIKDLGRKLNRALARKVEELARYRSEFFGRLKEVLGERRDIEVVGDRFVFQSEVLFESGSAELGLAGEEQMRRLAQTLVEIAAEIPPEINWVLRVDGHTDSRPINTAQFASNWELSTARAISVVRFLTEHGVPARRLAATGFAEFQPLDPRQDEIGFRRNRRIELKLTQR